MEDEEDTLAIQSFLGSEVIDSFFFFFSNKGGKGQNKLVAGPGLGLDSCLPVQPSPCWSRLVTLSCISAALFC